MTVGVFWEEVGTLVREDAISWPISGHEPSKFWAIWVTAAQSSKTIPKAPWVTVLSLTLKAKPNLGP